MNCIDGIEGVLKCILAAFEERYKNGEWDDTDFIPNIRLVIEGAARFVEQNEEIGSYAGILKEVLYKECRQWWLSHTAELRKKDAAEDMGEPAADDPEYYEHYFDYIYAYGRYPG